MTAIQDQTQHMHHAHTSYTRADDPLHESLCVHWSPSYLPIYPQPFAAPSDTKTCDPRGHSDHTETPISVLRTIEDKKKAQALHGELASAEKANAQLQRELLQVRVTIMLATLQAQMAKLILMMM